MAPGAGDRRRHARDPLPGGAGRCGPGRAHRRGGRRRMRAFADLYAALDGTTKTSEKVRALVRYFEQAPRGDAAWAVYFLVGRKPKQVVPTARLRAWAAAEAGVADWLFEESYHAV